VKYCFLSDHCHCSLAAAFCYFVAIASFLLLFNLPVASLTVLLLLLMLQLLLLASANLLYYYVAEAKYGSIKLLMPW